MAAPPGSSRLQQTLQSAVQAVQWTYSLFWQVCPQQGILVWGDGYYNGAIKTRKTVQPMEVSSEEASLQRSQQLRELYDSLSAEETNQPARRPCAALSPEDLTESEWFYLMSVSFSFPPGVGLPGKAFARQQHVWLTGSNESDSKMFSRAILAKSAGVQTVVCIPLMDGVVELGTTDRVQENIGLIQHVKSFFTNNQHHPNPAHSGHSTSNPAPTSDQHHRFQSSPLVAMYSPLNQQQTPIQDEEEEDEEDEDEDEDEDDDDGESDLEAETGRNSHPSIAHDPLQLPDPMCQDIAMVQAAGEPSELMQLEMSEDIRIGSPDDGSINLESGLNMLAMSQSDRRPDSTRLWPLLQDQISPGLQPPVSESDDGLLTLKLNDMGLEFSWSIGRLKAALPEIKSPLSATPRACSAELVKSLAVLVEEQNVPEAKIGLAAGMSAFLWLYISIHGFKPATAAVISGLPLGSGLGSSASFCVAFSAALLALSDAFILDMLHEGWLSFGEDQLELVNKWAFEGEKIIHGKPSGIDNTVSTFGNMIMFKSGKLTLIKPNMPLKMLITNTKVGRNTKALVAGVSERALRHPDAMASVFSAVDSISKELSSIVQSPVPDELSLTEKEEKLEELMEMNQGLLQCMGVSHASIETVLRTTLKYKLASKLTGAGGGGCVLTLLPALLAGTVIDKVISELESYGFQCLIAGIGGKGAEICFETS